jgi:hypothetical protein
MHAGMPSELLGIQPVALTRGVCLVPTSYYTPEQIFMNASAPVASTLNQCARYPAYTWCDEMTKKVWCKRGTALPSPRPLHTLQPV